MNHTDALDDALDALGKAFGNDWNAEQGEAMDRVRDAALALARSTTPRGDTAKRVEALVRRLVDQQAMPDTWWERELENILAVLRSMEAASPSSERPAQIVDHTTGQVAFSKGLERSGK